MQFADLHIHSTFSDGYLTPDEIINAAKSKGLYCISITDHDTIQSQLHLEGKFYVESPVLIPGVEISTEYCGHEIHFLAYFIDIHDISLQVKLNEVRQARMDRVKDIMKELGNLGILISKSDIEIDKYISVGRPHIAKILVQKGYACSIKEAFHQFLAKGKPAYVERYKINYKDALKLVTNAGGIPVLAHPGEIYKGLSIEKLIREFKVYGLRGIEVFHPAHLIDETNKFYNLARKYGLLITGGSDFHGSDDKECAYLGVVGLNKTLTDKLLKQISKK